MAWGVNDYPEPPANYYDDYYAEAPRCPVCWRECECLIKNMTGEIIGCEYCTMEDRDEPEY